MFSHAFPTPLVNLNDGDWHLIYDVSTFDMRRVNVSSMATFRMVASDPPASVSGNGKNLHSSPRRKEAESSGTGTPPNLTWPLTAASGLSG
jgi:hypothetical protein